MYGQVCAVYSPVWRYDWWVQVGYGGLVSEFNEFEPIGRVTVDDRRRVPLGQTDATPGTRYSVFQHPDGSILLRPVQSKESKQ